LLALACISVLSGFHMPLPWRGAAPHLPELYVAGIWAALVLGMVFISVYAWRLAEEARRMADALAETQIVLSREQKMSALGGLAAAAAHELGTPLGTIALVAKEVKNQLPEGSKMAEDMAPIAEQTARCRDILGQLSRSPEAEGLGEQFSHVTLTALVQEAVEPHCGGGVVIDIETLGDGAPPMVQRHPEILHGLGNFIENAVDFAAARVVVRADWRNAGLGVEIIDDGPGFASDILGRLGEPYITSRKLSDDGGGGLGLGVFIAKTLLERTGAEIEFRNQLGGGAKVGISWPRAEIA
jgi:two-component system sensor histidine kinase RegB